MVSVFAYSPFFCFKSDQHQSSALVSQSLLWWLRCAGCRLWADQIRLNTLSCITICLQQVTSYKHNKPSGGGCVECGQWTPVEASSEYQIRTAKRGVAVAAEAHTHGFVSFLWFSGCPPPIQHNITPRPFLGSTSACNRCCADTQLKDSNQSTPAQLILLPSSCNTEA